MPRLLAVIASFIWLLNMAFPVLADEAEGVVELVVDNPGPYAGGETIRVDVWIHSLVGFHAQFDWVQFDFRHTSSQIVLPELLTFDYSTLRQPHGFDEGYWVPELRLDRRFSRCRLLTMGGRLPVILVRRHSS